MNFKGRKGPLVLIIMDGVGIREEEENNAFKQAKTPFLDKVRKECVKKNLYTELLAHGTHVGLPNDNLMGNSEVAHNAIGAGKVIKQRATLAKEAISSGRLFNTSKWESFVSNSNTVHFIGLLSDGYVHSHISHLFGLLDDCVDSGVKEACVHILLDGRDVPPQSALKYINDLEEKLDSINKKGFDYKIASGGGRMRVTMDRYESDWSIVQRGWDAHVCGKGEGYFKSAEEAIKSAREESPDISDQFLPSFVIVDEKNNPVGKMKDGDGVIFFNFRGDRAVMISRAFDENDFSEFEKSCNPDVLYYGLLLYDDKLNIPHNFFIPPPKIKNTLTDFLCRRRIRQFSIAETHKFGHIKYFFLGNRNKSPCPEYDDYKEIVSEPAEMIESNPEMKAYEVRDELVRVLKSGKYKFLRVNFANNDMVGHTGNIKSAINSAETVDECVKSIVNIVNSLGGITLITADHGNIENMSSDSETSHTTNPVMFAIVDSGYEREYVINNSLSNPSLCNISATVLNLLGYNTPKHFSDSLIHFV